MNKYVIIIFGILLSVINYSCNGSSTYPFEPHAYIQKSTFDSANANTSIVFAGTILKISTSTDLPPSNVAYYGILNNILFSEDSCTADTGYFTFPYVTWFTGLKLFAFDRSKTKAYPLNLNIRPYPEISKDSVGVVWNNAQTVGKDMALRSTLGAGWKLYVSGDTVSLISEYYDPSSDIYWYVLHFKNNGNNQLPNFLSYEEYNFGPTFFMSLKTGIIKIQNWNPDSLISGAIYPDFNNQLWFTGIYFWAEKTH